MSLEHSPNRQRKTAKKHHVQHTDDIADDDGTPLTALRLLRLPEVLARVGVSAGTWLQGMRDGTCPKPIKIMPGSGSNGASGWVSTEIDAWIRARIKAERETTE